RRSGVPRRVGGDSTPRAPERRPAYPAFRGAFGPDRAHRRVALLCPSVRLLCIARTDRGRSFVRRGTPAGSAVSVPASSHADGHRPDDPPVRPVDYAALSAGWAAALATVLLASRDKGDEPVRPAEIVP